MNSPYMPSFLKLSLALVIGALGLTAVYAWRKNDAIRLNVIDEDEKSSWL